MSSWRDFAATEMAVLGYQVSDTSFSAAKRSVMASLMCGLVLGDLAAGRTGPAGAQYQAPTKEKVSGAMLATCKAFWRINMMNMDLLDANVLCVEGMME